MDIVIVGTDGYGLGGHGKCEPDVFWPRFVAHLHALGCTVDLHATSNGFFSSDRRYGEAVIVPVYNESCIGSPRAFAEIVGIVETAQARSERSIVCNAPRAGRIMGDKQVTNVELTAAGVPMPTLLRDPPVHGTIFSNARVGSGAEVRLTDQIDPARYNAAFIDTTQTYRDRRYFVCLRAMCIGATAYAVLVRARDTGEGSPSVHTSNTPRDPGLLNHLYVAVALPRMAEIAELCRRVEASLGFGFYAHDILPAASSTAIYLCETGSKFDEFSIRAVLARLEGELLAGDYMTPKVTETAARLFVQEARNRLDGVPRSG